MLLGGPIITCRERLGYSLSMTYVVSAEGTKRADMRQLVTEHFDEMIVTAAPESSHALDLTALNDPTITLFGMREDDVLVACGALKELSAEVGEIKTFRVVEGARGRGIGGQMLDALLTEGKSRGYNQIVLETGTEDFFETARALYRTRGFVETGPFGDYSVDPHSYFMQVDLV